MTETTERKTRFLERYLSGHVPWDDELPPPEVVQLVRDSEPGRALDLGCGYGRSAIYLAQHGWQADGVDFVELAIRVARERALEAGVQENARFFEAAISDLDFLTGPYDLAIDIGCMHGLDKHDLASYRKSLLRLLPKGAIYLLFAHLWDESVATQEEKSHWITDEQLLASFKGQGFELLDATYGTSRVGDGSIWPSAWYRFQRRGQ